jgi:hypothetical protein
MARAGKLSVLRVAAAVRNKRPGYTGDGGGLYLQISKYGTPSWVFRYRLQDGRLREMGLGPLDTWSLAEARERARRLRQLRAEGRDPIEERKAERAAARVEAARRWTSGNAPKLASRRAKPAGVMPSMRSNGRRHCRHMPSRSSATCRSRRSTPRSHEGAGADLE